MRSLTALLAACSRSRSRARARRHVHRAVRRRLAHGRRRLDRARPTPARSAASRARAPLPECRHAARAFRLLLPLQRARPPRRSSPSTRPRLQRRRAPRRRSAPTRSRPPPGTRCAAAAAAPIDDAVAASGANWVELGIYNEGARRSRSPPRAPTTSSSSSGWVTLSDPSAPGLAANGPTGVQSGLSASARSGRSATPRAARRRSPTRSTAAPDRAARPGVLLALRHRRERQRRRSTSARSPTGRTRVDGLCASRTRTRGAASARSRSRVDRTAPAQPQVHVAPDAGGAGVRLVGSRAVALSISTADRGRRRQLPPARLRPLGRASCSTDAPRARSRPRRSRRAAPSRRRRLRARRRRSATPRATARPRARADCAGTAPAARARRRPAPPLGLLAARDGAHLDLARADRGRRQRHRRRRSPASGRRPRRRARRRSPQRVAGGRPGRQRHRDLRGGRPRRGQVCLAVRPVSGAGLAAASAGVRCALVDEQPPEVTLSGAQRWSGGAQTIALAVTDANGAAFAQVLLDGVPSPPGDGDASRSPARAARAARRGARRRGQRDGRRARARRRCEPPVIGAVTADFLAREMRVGVADALAGVALAEVRLAGHGARDAALGRRPHGDRARARGPRAGRRAGHRARPRRLEPGQRRASAARPCRCAPLPVAARPQRRSRSRDRPGRAPARPPRVAVWAYPKGRVPARSWARTRRTRDGTFAVRVQPRRTTRYAVAVPESQELRGLAERAAGTAARDGAHRGAAAVRVRGDRLAVRARFAGRGEATRLHLLVHDVRGGRWVEACLERGRPGVRLERERAACGAPAASRRARAAAPGPTASCSRRRPARGRGARRRAPRAACFSRSERDQCGTFGDLGRLPGEGRDRRGPHLGGRACRSDCSLSGSAGPEASRSTPAGEPYA